MLLPSYLIFRIVVSMTTSNIEDTVARELVDELIKKGKGLIVEEGNEGQIRLTDMSGI
jgi:predicted transcriptional regulator